MRDPKNPIRITSLKVWRYEDFKKYFIDPSPERQIQFRKAMNFDEIEVVHDPTIESKIPEPVPGPQTKKIIAKPKGRARR